MPTILIILGIAIAVVLAAAIWWRWNGPGKRLRLGDFNLYYTTEITSEVASQVGQYLLRQKFADQSMDARLTRSAATYQLQLICEGPPAERQVMACEVLAAGLSDDVFGGAAVEVHVCDSIFRPISVIPHRGRFGRRISMNAAHLFYLPGVTDAEALDVATFLAGVGVFDDSPKIAQMNRSTTGFEFRLAVEIELTPEMNAGEQRMASDLSRVLKGAPVVVQFSKGLAATLRVVEQAAMQDSHVPGGPYQTRVFSLPGQPDGDDAAGSPVQEPNDL